MENQEIFMEKSWKVMEKYFVMSVGIQCYITLQIWFKSGLSFFFCFFFGLSTSHGSNYTPVP